MSEFQGGTVLKKPYELTKKRYINPDNQVCRGDACQIAKDNNVVWGVK